MPQKVKSAAELRIEKKRTELKAKLAKLDADIKPALARSKAADKQADIQQVALDNLYEKLSDVEDELQGLHDDECNLRRSRKAEPEIEKWLVTHFGFTKPGDRFVKSAAKVIASAIRAGEWK
jgi:hypothetical protein